MRRQLILILDFGGQYAQMIARRVRGERVYCEVRPNTVTHEEIAGLGASGLILAGDVKRAAPQLCGLGVPVLCVAGDADLSEHPPGGIRSETAAAVFAPDSRILRNFLSDTCGCRGDWSMADFLKQSVSDIRETVGDRSVLCAMSGGVDSSVCASLVSRAVGRQLTCIFVDTGLMRKNEGDEVEAAFKEHFDSNFVRVHAEQRFLGRLRGVTDPEQKRKIIGEEFIRVFEQEARKVGRVDFLVQGTIYPDVIESGVDGAAAVKSHHNVGGLPEVVDFKELIEPLRLLFKDEVRDLGRELGLPEYIVRRQPFPGPGLAIRCVGEVTEEKLARLREADAIFREEVQNAGLAQSINQYFAVMTDMRSVGVENGRRTYDCAVALRGVTTEDFMTADWAKIPYEVLECTARRIIGEVSGINRIVYDITSKPPATIEWE